MRAAVSWKYDGGSWELGRIWEGPPLSLVALEMMDKLQIDLAQLKRRVFAPFVILFALSQLKSVDSNSD